MENDAPQFMKRTGERDTGELRGECPQWILNVLDALAHAQDRPRSTVVNEVLGEFAKQKLHEATVIGRVCGSNPAVPEALRRT